jgi:transmembrane sensor
LRLVPRAAIARVGTGSTPTRATDIERQAAQWLIRSESEPFMATTRAEMESWLAADPHHRAAYVRIKEAWRRASRICITRPLDGSVTSDLLQGAKLAGAPGNNGSGRNWPVRIAAGAALTLTAYLIWLCSWIVFDASAWTPYTTSIGGYASVALPDGSSVQLNTDTEVRIRLDAQRREIDLSRGEALIRVARDPQRPFTVRTHGTALRVDQPDKAGATFGVRLLRAGDVDIAVTAGRVVFGPTGRILATAGEHPAGPQTALAAGEVAHIRPAGTQLTTASLEELNRKLSWTAGLLSFQGETLTEVIDEFNRYNRKRLVVVDPLIAARRIGGAFQATDPESFVSALQKSFAVRADEQHRAGSDDTIVRLSRAN